LENRLQMITWSTCHATLLFLIAHHPRSFSCNKLFIMPFYFCCCWKFRHHPKINGRRIIIFIFKAAETSAMYNIRTGSYPQCRSCTALDIL
jgi:hypothetical protein